MGLALRTGRDGAFFESPSWIRYEALQQERRSFLPAFESDNLEWAGLASSLQIHGHCELVTGGGIAGTLGANSIATRQIANFAIRILRAPQEVLARKADPAA